MVGKLDAYADELKFDLGGVRYGDPEEDEPEGPFMDMGYPLLPLDDAPRAIGGAGAGRDGVKDGKDMSSTRCRHEHKQ